MGWGVEKIRIVVSHTCLLKKIMEHTTYSLLILGTGPFASEVADLVSEIPDVRIAGFVGNMERQKCHEKLEGLPIYWVEDIAELTVFKNLLSIT